MLGRRLAPGWGQGKLSLHHAVDSEWREPLLALTRGKLGLMPPLLARLAFWDTAAVRCRVWIRRS